MGAWHIREWDPATRTGVVEGVYTLPFEAPDAPDDFVVGEPVAVSLVSGEPRRPHVRSVIPIQARLPDGRSQVEGAQPIPGVPALFRCRDRIREGRWSIWVGLDPYPDVYHPWGEVLCSQGELWVEDWEPELGEAVGGFIDVRDTGDRLVFRVTSDPRRWRGGAIGRRRSVRFVPPPPSDEWRAIEDAMANAFDITDVDDLRVSVGDEVLVCAGVGGRAVAEWRGPTEREGTIAAVVRAWRQRLREWAE